MAPRRDVAPLPLPVVDQIQWRDAFIRPLVLLAAGPPTPRAEEPPTHPDPGRPFTRRFRQQGMRGWCPGSVEVVPRGRAPHVPEAVRQEMARLKGLDAGVHSRALARMLFAPLDARIAHKPVKQLWPNRPLTTAPHRELWDSPTPPDRAHARWQALTLS